MKVTVSIASYNNAPYIERCLESVIHQTYSDLEILIVDDGSSDETLSIIERYKEDSRIRIICKENGGLSSTRQMSLNEASGEFICFIDADDYLMPTYVEDMLCKIIDDNSNICVCSTRFENAAGNYLDMQTKDFTCGDSLMPLRTTASQFYLNNKFLKELHLSDSWNKMYDISFLRNCGVEFCMPKGLNGTDTLFNRILSLYSPKYSTISKQLYIHVIYSSSAVHRKQKNLLKSFQIIAGTTIEVSRKLNLYNQIENWIIAKYQQNLCSALEDECFENASYKSCLKRLETLKKEHINFSMKYEENALYVSKDLAIYNKFVILFFHRCLFLLPLLYSLKYRVKLVKTQIQLVLSKKNSY